MLTGKLNMLIKNMVRSRVDSPKHDSLFLYTNIENVKIIEANVHKLEKTIFLIFHIMKN